MQVNIWSTTPVYSDSDEGEAPHYLGLSVCADVSDEHCARSGPHFLELPEDVTEAKVKKAIEGLYK